MLLFKQLLNLCSDFPGEVPRTRTVEVNISRLYHVFVEHGRDMGMQVIDPDLVSGRQAGSYFIIREFFPSLANPRISVRQRGT